MVVVMLVTMRHIASMCCDNERFTMSKKNGKGAERSNESAIAFCKIWQAAASVAEVAEKTGMQTGAASGRAVQYRKRGVPLKHFERHGGGNAYDWSAIAAAVATPAAKGKGK